MRAFDLPNYDQPVRETIDLIGQALEHLKPGSITDSYPGMFVFQDGAKTVRLGVKQRVREHGPSMFDHELMHGFEMRDVTDRVPFGIARTKLGRAFLQGKFKEIHDQIFMPPFRPRAEDLQTVTSEMFTAVTQVTGIDQETLLTAIQTVAANNAVHAQKQPDNNRSIGCEQ